MSSSSPAAPLPGAAYPPGWGSVLFTVRVPAFMVLLTFLCMIVPPQTRDMLAMLNDHTLLSFSLEFAYVILGFTVWFAARSVLAARFGVGQTAAARQVLAVAVRCAWQWTPRLLALAVGLIGGLSYLLRSPRWDWSLWLHLIVLVALFAALFVYLVRRVPDVGPADLGAAAALPLRQAPSPRGLRQAVFHDIGPRLHDLVAFAPFGPVLGRLVFLGTLLFLSLLAVSSFLGSALSFFSLGIETVLAIGRIFPGPGAGIFAFAIIAPALTLLTWLADGWRIEFRLCGALVRLRRPPALTALVIWVVGWAAVAPLHVVRIDDAASPAARPTLEQRYRAWAAACGAAGYDPQRPVLVAASGGASRAALWAARVLTELDRTASDARRNNRRPPAVFAVSSVSGGSLGVAGWEALRAGGADQGCAPVDPTLAGQSLPGLGHDALGPLLAGAVLLDIPRAVLGPVPAVYRWLTGRSLRGGDRGEVLERAFAGLWRRAAGGKAPGFTQGYLALQSPDRPGTPLWLANSTEVRSGWRVLTVPFRSAEDTGGRFPAGEAAAAKFWPFAATRDALAMLNADLPAATVIHNTARFPFLSPSGELARAPAPLPCPRDSSIPCPGPSEVVDGGYFDNGGTLSVLDLAGWLQREVAGVHPIIVQATSDGEAPDPATLIRCGSAPADPRLPAPGGQESQLLAPLLSVMNVRGGHAEVTLQLAKDRFCPDPQAGGPQAFFHFYLHAAPPLGAAADWAHFPPAGWQTQDWTAVPLNWVLSDDSISYIWDGAMGWPGSPDAPGNVSELEKLQTAYR